MGFVETVALVQQQIGLFSVQFECVYCLFHRPFHVCHTALHGVEFDEIAVRRLRDDMRERRFAAAGRPPEYTAAQPVELDGAAQQAPLRHYMVLPDKFVEIVRAHLVGQRLGVIFIVVQIE